MCVKIVQTWVKESNCFHVKLSGKYLFARHTVNLQCNSEEFYVILNILFEGRTLFSNISLRCGAVDEKWYFLIFLWKPVYMGCV